MALDDGRVVSNFLSQALKGEPMTVYGDGKQTRSFQYISDLIAGMVSVMESDFTGPFNIGNPDEFTMIELANKVKAVANPSAQIVYKENTADDPKCRRPNITKAKETFGWEPKVKLEDGLKMMVEDFKKRLNV